MRYENLQEHEIIEKLKKTRIGNDKKVCKLVKTYLQNKYSLISISIDQRIYSMFCYVIKTYDLYCLLKPYQVYELRIFSHNNAEILTDLVKQGYEESCTLITECSLFHFNEVKDLEHISTHNLRLLAQQFPAVNVFYNILKTRNIVELKKEYTDYDDISEKIRHMIIEALYKEDCNYGRVSTNCNWKVIRSEDKSHYISLIVNNKNVDLASRCFFEFENGSPERNILLTLFESYDDGRYSFKLLDTYSKELDQTEKLRLENVMRNCSNPEFKFYWMYTNNQQAELRRIFGNSAAMITFLEGYTIGLATDIINELRKKENQENNNYSEMLVESKGVAHNYGSNTNKRHS